MPYQDLTGQVIGENTVLRLDRFDARRRSYWLIRDKKARERVVRIDKLGAPTSRSHGQYRTPEHNSWRGAIWRCTSPTHADFKYYGGRGISVCAAWRESFEAFFADMGRKPSPRHSLDRIDNDGDYEPGNCRWATYEQQRANQRPRRRSGVPSHASEQRTGA